MALSIPSGIFDIYNDAVDNIWSKPILLVYPSKKEECPNCFNNGYQSNGVYRPGGPYSFENGFPCPYCNGEGFKYIDTTETITARIYYSRKDWLKIGIEVNVPDAAMQMVSKITDLPKLQRANYIVPNYYENIDYYNAEHIGMVGSYYPMGFTQNPTKYVVTYWKSKNDTR